MKAKKAKNAAAAAPMKARKAPKKKAAPKKAAPKKAVPVSPQKHSAELHHRAPCDDVIPGFMWNHVPFTPSLLNEEGAN